MSPRDMCEHIVSARILKNSRGEFVTTGQQVWKGIGSNDLSVLLMWYEAACVALDRRHAKDKGYPQYDRNREYEAGDHVMKDGKLQVCIRNDHRTLDWYIPGEKKIYREAP